jgi:hypothetical protein
VQIDWNRKRPFKKFSSTDLHLIKDNRDLNPKENAGAAAELEYRQRFWPILVAIATIITAIITVTSFVLREFIKAPTLPSGIESKDHGAPSKPIEPEKKISHEKHQK